MKSGSTGALLHPLDFISHRSTTWENIFWFDESELPQISLTHKFTKMVIMHKWPIRWFLAYKNKPSHKRYIVLLSIKCKWLCTVKNIRRVNATAIPHKEVEWSRLFFASGLSETRFRLGHVQKTRERLSEEDKNVFA